MSIFNPFVMIGDELINLNNVTHVKKDYTESNRTTILFVDGGSMTVRGSVGDVNNIIRKEYNIQGSR